MRCVDVATGVRLAVPIHQTLALNHCNHFNPVNPHPQVASLDHRLVETELASRAQLAAQQQQQTQLLQQQLQQRRSFIIRPGGGGGGGGAPPSVRSASPSSRHLAVAGVALPAAAGGSSGAPASAPAATADPRVSQQAGSRPEAAAQPAASTGAASAPTVSGVVNAVQSGLAGAGGRLMAYCSVCVLLVTGLLMADVALICFLFLSKVLALEASVGELAALACMSNIPRSLFLHS